MAGRLFKRRERFSQREAAALVVERSLGVEVEIADGFAADGGSPFSDFRLRFTPGTGTAATSACA